MEQVEQQDLSVKKGEVTFRQKLASQQFHDGQMVFPELDNHDRMIDLMNQRAGVTRQAMAKLRAEGISISPFIELGTERCHRSIVLVNEFEAHGIAIDISLDMLRLGAEVAKGLGYSKLPLRICCDAYNLPIRDSALSFAFCYATLHHFPDPGPILKELSRVLEDQAVFYFDEEPVRGSIYSYTRLYQRHGHHLSPLENFLNRVGILPLISKAGGVEIEHGVLEEEFDLSTWQRALAPYQNPDVIVNKKLNFRLKNFQNGLPKVLAEAIGGNIEVLCRVEKDQAPAHSFSSLAELIRCPACASSATVPLHYDESRHGYHCEIGRAHV